MQEQILKMISTYGVETLVIALAINILTGLFKLPIKALAKKMKNGSNLTRWIVFLPIILGAGLTYGYGYLKTGVWSFNDSEITVWLSASSLSLSIYAILEKMFPSKRKILEEHEIEENKKLIETIKTITQTTSVELESTSPIGDVNAVNELEVELAQSAQESAAPLEHPMERKRIVLRGVKK